MECQNCGEDYERLGQHWAMSCSYPRLSVETRAILSGLLMGDGHIPEAENGNTQMRVRMVNKDFLQWLDSELSELSSGMRFVKSAKESASDMRSNGWRPNAKAEDYSDVWEVSTRTHPYFKALRASWYNSSKQFADNLIPHNPMTYKMWYVTDGGLCSRNGRSDYSYFRMDSNNDFSNNIVERFNSEDIKANSRDGGSVVAIEVDSMNRFLEYIGPSVPGFEYKWGDEK